MIEFHHWYTWLIAGLAFTQIFAFVRDIRLAKDQILQQASPFLAAVAVLVLLSLFDVIQ